MSSSLSDNGGGEIELHRRKSSRSLSCEHMENGDDTESQPHDATSSLLGVYSAAALLTADILGTGLLALPQDVQVLGTLPGLLFLVACLPLNWWAGQLLSHSASFVEQRIDDDDKGIHGDGLMRLPQKLSQTDDDDDGDEPIMDPADTTCGTNNGSHYDPTSTNAGPQNKTSAKSSLDPAYESIHNPETTTINNNDHPEFSTHDFISIAHVLCPKLYGTVMAIFYTNIFLVLGDYILVMSHAVSAVFGDNRMCLPYAGILAGGLMFGFCQIRTMAHLGHGVTLLSLTTLCIVVVQCLVGAQRLEQPESPVSETSAIRKLSALASVAFATGSNKLLLNIRHEMAQRERAPRSLLLSQVVFGSVYVSICVLAGPNPPSFLFDSIPHGLPRRLGGMLLWTHVSISYAINSQAICSSLDTLFVSRMLVHTNARKRWLLLTASLSVSSYLVANSIPMFKDLVALIGALTTIPLTLILPVIYHRTANGYSILVPTRQSVASWLLLMFGLAFLVLGFIGSVGSTELDWTGSGKPFSCSV